MRSGRLLALLLLLLSLVALVRAPGGAKPTVDDGPQKQDTGEPTEGTDTSGQGTAKTTEEKTEPCIPPVIVVVFFTAYGIFLLGLYIYGGKQWIGLMEARYKMRKFMALELALIHYDEYCERRQLHGRAELFVPASNDGFFLDPDVQDCWLSVNNLRKRVYIVPTQDYEWIGRENWDAMKRRKDPKKRKEKLKKLKDKAKKKPNSTNDYTPVLEVDILLNRLREYEFFKDSSQDATKKAKEEGAANSAEPQEEEKKASNSDPKQDKKEAKKEEKEEEKEKKPEAKSDEKKEEKKEEEEKKEDKEAEKEKKPETKKDVKKDEKEKKEEKKEGKDKRDEKKEKSKETKLTKDEDKKEEKKEEKEGKKGKEKESLPAKDAKETKK